MSHRTLCRLFAACLMLIITLAASPPAHAGDCFLTLGGGYAPPGNQVSLERNVIYFEKVLKGLHLADRPQTMLFADGQDPGRDMVVSNDKTLAPQIDLLLAEILGSTDGLDEAYESNDIPFPHRACTVEHIDDYFDHCSGQLHDSDRLIVYFTGHGSPTRDKGTQNTLMNLWAHQAISMRDFVKRLDKVPAHVPVVLVMVQCFGGGFGNVIFNEGDPTKGLSDADRCGFFATVYNRPASGCTSDIDEAEYQEYSSYFWAALLGADRLGHKVDPPDYNHDGHVSFDEAHAYALIKNDSIDVSVKTSDVLLRQYSKTQGGRGDLFTAETSYSRLAAVASPAQRAVLDALSEQLKLDGEDRTQAAHRMESEFAAERQGLSSREKLIRRQWRQIRGRLGAMLQDRWPELANPWHPQVCFIVHNDTEKILDALNKHPDFARFQKLDDQMSDLEDKQDRLERNEVKCMRFIYTAESVALAHNLPRVADAKIVEHYQRLLKSEAGTLGSLDK